MKSRRAFEREASLLGNLRHFALPKVMDYFTEDDGDFLMMEFIPGYDLAGVAGRRWLIKDVQHPSAGAVF